MASKEQATIDFLMTCDLISGNPLFFQFIKAKDNNKQLLMLANDKSLNQTNVDGSVSKQFTFTLVDFKSVAYNALVAFTPVGTTEIGTTPAPTDENVEEYMDVQGIIDWITLQDRNRNYPDFGSSCQIQKMRALTDNPNLNGVDSSTKPSLAKYSISIQIDYLDTSEVIWNQ